MGCGATKPQNSKNVDQPITIPDKPIINANSLFPS